MTHFHLDWETRSEIPLDVRGLHNYASHPSTQIILGAYAEGDQKVKLWQPHLEPLPAELREALEDPFVTVCAWNAAFERSLSKFVLGIDKPAAEWFDPMVNARYLSLPGSLEDVGDILGLHDSQKKMEEGHRLVKLFTEPASLGGTETLFGISETSYHDWASDPADWQLFCDYNRQDVVAERAIMKKLARFPLPEQEQRNWVLDQAINDRGMPVDRLLVDGAAVLAKKEMEMLTGRLKKLTGIENPNSRDQFLEWIASQGYTFSGLGKAFVARAMAGECDLTPLGREALEIRKMTSKSSVGKYTRIADTVGSDGRLRYQFAFMGAARTGRWSGKGAAESDTDTGGVQLQNLSRPVKEVEKKMDLAIDLVQKMDYDGVKQSFSNVLDVVVSTIRASFKAPDGFRFVVADLNAVENRGLGYLSRCDAILKVFRERFVYHGPSYPEKEIFDGADYPMCPYLDFASKMYNIPYAELFREWKILLDATKRTNAKPATLGCGYQLSGGEEIITEEGDKVWTGLLGYARNMGITLSSEEANKSVAVFRAAYPEVTWMWYDMESAAVKAVRSPGQVFGSGVPTNEWERDRCIKRGIDPDATPLVSFRCTGKKVLEMILPSGRSLNYINPMVEEKEVDGKNGPYKKAGLSYEGINQKSKQWSRIDTHGGKLVENADQAICRDVLVAGMRKADERGFEIVGHVHDELITLVPIDSPLSVEDLCECMAAPVPWAGDAFPLGAEGWTGIYYRKS